MTPFLDLHAHFPMHTQFPPLASDDVINDTRKKVEFHAANLAFNYERGTPRVTLDRWFADPGDAVTGFGSVLYDPEDEFFIGQQIIPAAYSHLEAQMKNVEKEIHCDNRVVVAKNPKTVEHCLVNGKKFIFHTVEGGFSLGGDPANVHKLADRGVAYIIPAHLFYRAVATHENGFPPLATIPFQQEIHDQPDVGLTDLGSQIVTNMFERGVLVDITHASERAQQEMFKLADKFPDRPLISSHSSVRAVADHGLNLSDEAVRRIAKSNGIIGLIFYQHWLRHPGIDGRQGFRLLFDVIEAIKSITGSYDHIGVGSDLDGFIEPIEECSDYSKMSNLVDALRQEYQDDIVQRILWRNALRVLKAGWTGVAESAATA